MCCMGFDMLGTSYEPGCRRSYARLSVLMYGCVLHRQHFQMSSYLAAELLVWQVAGALADLVFVMLLFQEAV